MTEHEDRNDRLVSDTFEESWAPAGALAATRAAASIRRRRRVRTGTVCGLAACLVISLLVALPRKPVEPMRGPHPDATIAVTSPRLEIISDRELLDLLNDRQFVASRGGDGRIREVIFLDDLAGPAEPTTR